MVQLSKKQEAIFVISSFFFLSAVSSFTFPSSSSSSSIIHHLPLLKQKQQKNNFNSIHNNNNIHPRYTYNTQLFVQSKESTAIIATTAETSEKENENTSDIPITTTTIIQSKKTTTIPVLTTSEEASIYLADAPITPQEGAYIAEESITTSDGLFWRGVVVILCALWASNFACAKVVLDQPGVDASLFAVARFSVAALSLAPGAIGAARKGMISWETARGAVICGSWVAFGYMGQLIGLMTTTPSRACVICSLNCIFVAIVAELMRVNSTKERGYVTDFDLRKLIPALIAVTGVAIIELKGAAGGPVIGDLIAFTQPIGFGMGYLQLEELMRKEPSAALPVSAIKLVIVTLAACIFFESSPHATAMVSDLATSVDVLDAGTVMEGAKSIGEITGIGFQIPDFTPILESPLALGAIFYTGIVTTSLALFVEAIAFQRVPATDASIILTTEPLFAAAASAVLVGETFGPSDAIGAFFIVGACIYAIKMGSSEEEVCIEETKKCYLEEV